ncbi:MAG: hypothetical protein ACYC63_15770 [Armatimonadota bacterium]
MNKRGDESKESWDHGRGKPVPYGKPPHRGNNPLSGTELDEADRQRIEAQQPAPYTPPVVSSKPRSKTKSKSRKPQLVDSGGPPERTPLMVIFLFVILGFLVVGVVSLIVINRFFPDWPHRAPAPVEEAAAVVRPVPPPPPPPPAPPARQATSPVAAVKLMLTASLAGDYRTAYAQWDIEPDDIITVQRGVPITLAEQTEEAASIGTRARTEDYTQRLLSQSGNEARVGQYKDNVLTQVYSLRRVGPYWKLYNATAP